MNSSTTDLTELFVQTAKQAAVNAAEAQIALIEHLLSRCQEQKELSESAIRACDSIGGKLQAGRYAISNEVRICQLKQSLKAAQRALAEALK